MHNQFKKLLFLTIYNISLFFILIIGIQNSNNKSKIFFYKNETVELPISFIVGIAFISGSIFGSFISLNKKH